MTAPPQEPPGQIPFTPRAKKVLELAFCEARQLGHNYVGTEHILLGLLREGEGVAARTLIGLGADLDTARKTVMRLLHGWEKERNPEPPQPPPVIHEGPVTMRTVLAAVERLGERLGRIEKHLGTGGDGDG